MCDNKSSCEDISPVDDCNKSCCPDYVPDEDWCKAFNKRTLEQQRETTRMMLDGIWFNIEDARNTIAQTEQYLAMIYEILLAAHDQLMSVSATTARTVGDFEAASVRIKELVTEIFNVVASSQYNGRYLLKECVSNDLIHDNDGNATADTVTNEKLFGDVEERNTLNFRLASSRGHTRQGAGTSKHNDFIFELPCVGPYSLGLVANQKNTVATSGAADAPGNQQDFLHSGLGHNPLGSGSNPTYAGGDYDNDGVIDPDNITDDDIDHAVNAFNAAIKTVGVELDKMRAYRYVLCLREKQVRIWKKGQDTCFEHKCKI